MDLTSEHFARLGLQLVADLSGALASGARTYHVKDIEGRLTDPGGALVLKAFTAESTAPADALFSPAKDDFDFSTTGYGPDQTLQSDPETDLQTRTEHQELNWSLGEMSRAGHLTEIYEFGLVDDVPFLIRPHFEKSVSLLCETKVEATHELLFPIADAVWSALAFLHQPALNRPHGNLKASNVLISQGHISTAQIVLCDAVRTPETSRRAEKVKDLQSLGILLLQLITSTASAPSAYQALARAETLSYASLGDRAADWKTLICNLLEESSFESEFDTAALRDSLLAPLSTTREPEVAQPAELPASPPNVGLVVVDDSSSARIRQHVAKGNHTAALKLALESAQSSETKDLVTNLNSCCSRISSAALLQDDIFADFEEAAGLGSSVAALRLGQVLSDQPTHADEALLWLEKASELGQPSASVPLSKLYENGTPTHPADPELALSTLQKSPATEERDFAIATLILRGQTSRPMDEAVPFLESAADKGHVPSMDLLGQVLASGQGTPRDEQRAFTLFSQAWQMSESADAPDYTAAHNLAVCYAQGLGTPRDLSRSLDHLRRGAKNGHFACRETLKQLEATT